MVPMTSHLQLSIIFSDYSPKALFKARAKTKQNKVNKKQNRWPRREREWREKRAHTLEEKEGPGGGRGTEGRQPASQWA